jgi:hypothetical protein
MKNLQSIKESWKEALNSYFWVNELKYFCNNFFRPWRLFTDIEFKDDSNIENDPKLIYIASPYSHELEDVRVNNFKLVAKFTAKLVSEGHIVISPIVYGHILLDYQKMPSDWDFWKKFCLTFLNRCDEIIVYQMPGWENSRGISEEIQFAEKNGIKIVYKEFND